MNISYPWPIHIMLAYANPGYRKNDFPVTEKLAKEVFSLPLYPSLRNEAQEKVIFMPEEAL